ncbi:MAG: glutaredoxin family protein [Rhodocyclaceae bacterium]|nr:glutaredoxin family protein [Rhodocyclaceae bacterium]MDP2196358.1 glutaredoxin family protein [Rhodocyclaceae bacterium]
MYGRPYCHLCDDMLAALEATRGEFDFAVEVVDVDAHPEWVERYDQLVPVLTLAGEEICHYFLDLERLRTVLRQAGADH